MEEIPPQFCSHRPMYQLLVTKYIVVRYISSKANSDTLHIWYLVKADGAFIYCRYLECVEPSAFPFVSMAQA
jgi:hypothetical protein